MQEFQLTLREKCSCMFCEKEYFCEGQELDHNCQTLVADVNISQFDYEEKYIDIGYKHESFPLAISTMISILNQLGYSVQ